MNGKTITEEQLLEALRRYWGYGSLRGTQSRTIRCVLEGRDTLSLMPTGGGKSLTYQLPGLLMEGLCVVVTPLVALIALGGVLYTLGAWFYARKGFRYHHMVWHLLIDLAVAAHFAGIVFYLY